MRASSRPIFPRRQLPWTRGPLLIFSALLLSAPRSCTPFQTWKLVPPFFGEKAATPNEGWHSSSSSSCSSYSSSSLLLQLPSSHSGLRPRVSVCSQTQQPRHFIFGAFPTSVGKYLYRLSVWLNLQENFELKKNELNMIMSSYIFGEQPLPILASAPIQCLGKIVSIWIYKQLLSCHNRPNLHPIGGDHYQRKQTS